MSVKENTALVRRAFDEVWNGKNIDLADELFAPDFIGHPGTEEDIRGPGGVKEFIGRFREAFPDLTFTIEHHVAEGDVVATRWTSRGTHDGELMGIEPTGKRVTSSGMTFTRIRDGKIVEGWTNWDTLGLLQQLGATPQLARA